MKPALSETVIMHRFLTDRVEADAQQEGLEQHFSQVQVILSLSVGGSGGHRPLGRSRLGQVGTEFPWRAVTQQGSYMALLLETVQHHVQLQALGTRADTLFGYTI